MHLCTLTRQGLSLPRIILMQSFVGLGPPLASAQSLWLFSSAILKRSSGG